MACDLCFALGQNPIRVREGDNNCLEVRLSVYCTMYNANNTVTWSPCPFEFYPSKAICMKLDIFRYNYYLSLKSSMSYTYFSQLLLSSLNLIRASGPFGVIFANVVCLFISLFCRNGYRKSCHQSDNSTCHYLSRFTWK